jgi:hypothetical protein
LQTVVGGIAGGLGGIVDTGDDAAHAARQLAADGEALGFLMVLVIVLIADGVQGDGIALQGGGLLGL